MTELSSVSGLRGVREALAELFELVESGELVRDISRDGESDWLRRAAKLTLTLKKAQLALSLPPSPQADERISDVKRQLIDYLVANDGQDSIEMLADGVLRITALDWLSQMNCGHAKCFQRLQPTADSSSLNSVCAICQIDELSVPREADEAMEYEILKRGVTMTENMLARWILHKDECAKMSAQQCTCGLDEALNRLLLPTETRLNRAPAGAQGQVQGVQALAGEIWNNYVEAECSCDGANKCSLHERFDKCLQDRSMCGYTGILANFLAARDVAFSDGVEAAAYGPADVSSQAGQEKRAMHPNRKDAITHEQARKSLQRFVNLHFHNAGEKSRASIPAHQDDDDILLSDYISQQEAAAPSAGSGQEGLRESQAWMASVNPRPEIVAVSSSVWGIRHNGGMVCAPTIEEAVTVLRAALLPPASKPPSIDPQGGQHDS